MKKQKGSSEKQEREKEEQGTSSTRTAVGCIEKLRGKVENLKEKLRRVQPVTTILLPYVKYFAVNQFAGSNQVALRSVARLEI